MQIKQDENALNRVRMLIRQHAMLPFILVLVGGLMLGAAGMGAYRALFAGGVTLERREDEADGRAALPNGSNESDEKEQERDVYEPDAAKQSTVTVDVAGAVASPSVVTLPEGSRVFDAIEAAGGLVADADATSINQAAILNDGMQVRVPKAGEAPAAAGTSPLQPAAAGGDAGGAMVNLNSASVAELDALPGVGPSTAQAIVSDREEHGPFARIEDLMRVSGIGEKKFEKLRASICV